MSCANTTRADVPLDTAGQQKRRYAWAELLARVFAVDVLECPRCSSRMQRVEWCTHPERIRAVLATGPPNAAERVKTA